VDYDTQLKSTDNEKTRELTDRNIIFVGAERFNCVDVLFQPNSVDKEARGIHDISFQNNMKCDAYTCKESCDNIVLSGGTTMFQ